MDRVAEGFSDASGREDLFGPRFGFFVPPAVEIKRLPPLRSAVQYPMRDDYRYIEEKETPCVVYPVPGTWRVALIEAQAERLRTCGYRVMSGNLMRSGERTPSTVPCNDTDALRAIEWYPEWGPRVTGMLHSQMEQLGWKWKTETDGLLKSFLDLAQDDPSAPQTVAKVQAFVQRWGPLWLCRNPTHFDCHWAQSGGHPWSPCMWAPIEEVREIVRKAWQARAVVEAAEALRCLRPIPEHIRPYLLRATLLFDCFHPGRFNVGAEDLALLRRGLSIAINANLTCFPTARGMPSIHLQWDEDKGTPTLNIVAGFGVVSSVWLEIAQMVSGINTFLFCNGCGYSYPREKKYAGSNKRNFCPACGTKAAKKLWWREHGKERREKKSKRQEATA